MARPKQIEDSVLLDLIKQYFYEECGANVKKLKISEIVLFINNHGYPTYPATTLRRTPAAIEYIEQLKQTVKNDDYITCVSYQTIDATELLRSHTSRDSLVKAITERDTYYKKVSDAAARSFDQYNRILADLEKETEARKNLEQCVADLESQLEDSMSQNREQQTRLRAYKRVLDDYVNPDIAEMLLMRAGIKPERKTNVQPEALDAQLITSQTNIRTASKSGSKVIEGLFKKDNKR